MVIAMLNLKNLREDRDIKQKEIADYLNMSRANYSRIENEIQALDINTAEKIADYFNVPLDFLIKGRKVKSILTDEDIIILNKAIKVLHKIEKSRE